MENEKKPPVIVGPDAGETLSVAGGTYRILVSGAQTNGAFAVIEMLVPPGGGPGPHAHAQIDESFFVVSGEIEVRSEYGTHTAVTGSFIHIPKGGVVHGFKNKSPENAHLLCTVVPAGLEAFFKEIGQPVISGEFLPPPAMDQEAAARIGKIAEKYGQVLYPPDYLQANRPS